MEKETEDDLQNSDKDQVFIIVFQSFTLPQRHCEKHTEDITPRSNTFSILRNLCDKVQSPRHLKVPRNLFPTSFGCHETDTSVPNVLYTAPHFIRLGCTGWELLVSLPIITPQHCISSSFSQTLPLHARSRLFSSCAKTFTVSDHTPSQSHPIRAHMSYLLN